MYNLKDKKGNYFIQDLIKAADSSDKGGFFSYFWPKPGIEEAVAKLSFAKKLKGWDWNLGTGSYTDDVDAAIAKKAAMIKTNIKNEVMKIVAVVAGLIVIALQQPRRKCRQP